LLVESGDFRRFAALRRLMSYLGLTPSEYFSDQSPHRRHMIETGNRHTRRSLVEAAWHYRHRPRTSARAAISPGEEALREPQMPLAYLAALLEAEMTERAERREKRRLIEARFPVIKRLEDFRFADNPKVSQAAIAALAEASWIDDRESVILLGESAPARRC
jgi:DNA replication protein DnaC